LEIKEISEIEYAKEFREKLSVRLVADGGAGELRLRREFTADGRADYLNC
jgi:hypothetical protein